VHLYYLEIEAIMRQALMTGLLAGAMVFVGGVIFGWEYAMFLAFVVLMTISLINYMRQS
jgi:hypothetical protein